MFGLLGVINWFAQGDSDTLDFLSARYGRGIRTVFEE